VGRGKRGSDREEVEEGNSSTRMTITHGLLDRHRDLVKLGLVLGLRCSGNEKLWKYSSPCIIC